MYLSVYHLDRHLSVCLSACLFSPSPRPHACAMHETHADRCFCFCFCFCFLCPRPDPDWLRHVGSFSRGCCAWASRTKTAGPTAAQASDDSSPRPSVAMTTLRWRDASTERAGCGASEAPCAGAPSARSAATDGRKKKNQKQTLRPRPCSARSGTDGWLAVSMRSPSGAPHRAGVGPLCPTRFPLSCHRTSPPPLLLASSSPPPRLLLASSRLLASHRTSHPSRSLRQASHTRTFVRPARAVLSGEFDSAGRSGRRHHISLAPSPARSPGRFFAAPRRVCIRFRQLSGRNDRDSKRCSAAVRPHASSPCPALLPPAPSPQPHVPVQLHRNAPPRDSLLLLPLSIVPPPRRRTPSFVSRFPLLSLPAAGSPHPL